MESKIECDVDALKLRLPEYLNAIGHPPEIQIEALVHHARNIFARIGGGTR